MKHTKTLFLALLIAISLLTLQCSKIKQILGQESTQESKVVVIFANGDVNILRANEKFKPKVGTILDSKDIIMTESGSLDIQNKNEDLIRVKSYSKLSIASLEEGESSKTTVDIQWGELVVKTKKLKSNSEFKVLTPTTVAGVRGTIFTVELEKDKIPKVKVFEGSVAVGARFQPINIEKGSIDDQSYEEMISFLEKNEVILGEMEESNLSPKLQELVILINNRQLVNQDIQKTELTKQMEDMMDKETFLSSPQKQAEIDTLVGTESALVDKALESSKNPESVNDSSISEAIAQDHKKNLGVAVTNLEANAEKQNLKSEADIQKFYSVLEIVNTSDGNHYSGAIITQVGGTIILHSTEGIKKLNLDEVESVDYKSLQLNTKAKK
jgi:hypothetical protein